MKLVLALTILSVGRKVITSQVSIVSLVEAEITPIFKSNSWDPIIIVEKGMAECELVQYICCTVKLLKQVTLREEPEVYIVLFPDSPIATNIWTKY